MTELRGKFTPYGNFTSTQIFDSREPEVINTKNDFIEPIYTLILNDGLYNDPQQSKLDSKSFSAFVFYFKRDSLFNNKYSLVSYTSNSISGLNVEDLRVASKKYDLSIKDNISSEVSITHGVPLTPQEIQRAQQDIKDNLPKTPLESYQEQCVKWFEYAGLMRQATIDGKPSITYPDGRTVNITLGINQLDALVVQKKDLCAKAKVDLQIP